MMADIGSGLAMERAGYRLLAYVCVGLALAGVVLPLLPTTPFVLLAAWAASKGSPAFAQWLENHGTFGPIIDNWRTRRAIPVRAKWLACGMLAFSWSMLALLGTATWLLAGLAVFFTALAGYLVSRPS